MSELVGETGSGRYAIRSLLSDSTRNVQVRKRLMNATMTYTFIPLTHTRMITVAAGVTCVPPSDASWSDFDLIGDGETAWHQVSSAARLSAADRCAPHTSSNPQRRYFQTTGSRICPSRYLTQLVMKLAIATILRDFDITNVSTEGGGRAQDLMKFVMATVGLSIRHRLRGSDTSL